MPAIGSDEYSKGVCIMTLEGLMMYRGRKFFRQDALTDWEVLETYSLRQILWMLHCKSLYVARPIPPEIRRLNHARKMQASS